MPRGPRGEKRPADVIGAAVMVAKIATGETNEKLSKKNLMLAEHGATGGQKGGKARAKALSARQRQEIARVAVLASGASGHR